MDHAQKSRLSRKQIITENIFEQSRLIIVMKDHMAKFKNILMPPDSFSLNNFLLIV